MIARSFLAGIVALGALASGAHAGDTAILVPPPAMDAPRATGALQTAVLAGGCFWGVQGVYQHLEGVTRAVSGYTGGTDPTPTYEEVSRGITGHAEAVEIRYDPAVITYGELLRVFFSVAHDPTEVNRQGPDVGTQYRTAIFTSTEEQAKIAEAYIRQLDQAKAFPKPIATTVSPLAAFHAAEDYHQDYMHRFPFEPYIVFHDLPKIANLKKLFPKEYRTVPVKVGAS